LRNNEVGLHLTATAGHLTKSLPHQKTSVD